MIRIVRYYLKDGRLLYEARMSTYLAYRFPMDLLEAIANHHVGWRVNIILKERH